MKSFLFLLLLFIGLIQVQAAPPRVLLHLNPQRLKGGHFLHKNVSFGNYKTQRFRRTLGSFFAARSFQPANLLRLEGIPLYHHKLRWSKDVFRFDLYNQGQLASTVECRATLLTNETFTLFRLKQDSSFFGARNVDLLEARIQLANRPNQFWDVVATNLNGTKREMPKGIIRKDSITIDFIQTPAVLKERTAENYSSLYQVYAFSLRQETIAAVTVDEKGRQKKVWMKPQLDSAIQDAIASTLVILTSRRTIYK